MAAPEIKLTLPGDIAREAEANRLLTPESLEGLLREELRGRRVDQLFEAVDRLGRDPNRAMATVRCPSSLIPMLGTVRRLIQLRI